MGVDHQTLNLIYRKWRLRLLPEYLRDIDGGKRGVIGKIQSLFIAGPAVGQSGELVSVAETGLNLKSCAVNVIDILAHIGQIVGKSAWL